MAICAKVDQQWVRLWEDIPEVLAGGLLLILVVAGRGQNGWGTTWLGANCFFYVFVQAYAGWLHRFPGLSKSAMVLLLIWGAVLAVCVVSLPFVRWLGAGPRETA